VNMLHSESTAKYKAMIIRELKDMNSKMRIGYYLIYII
jgi:hypothetical protein